ncbi:MAG: ankyrin repeat domain-containing protein [Actinobacteria bacterium]|nr:ankyrin repeat domain-containing protein [Actinomycetota bacterium]
MLPADDPLVQAFTDAVQRGDVDSLVAMLAEHPALATERFGDEQSSRAALHVATDWPGHFPRVADMIAVLAAAGADVDARFAGPHRETPLHWAASSDDIAAIDALVAAGADLEADGGVLTGGPPLDDAIVFSQYAAAHRLVTHGARATFWHAAPLGDVALVRSALASRPADGIDAEDITNAAWHAARAGRLATLELLVDAGADLTAVLWEDRTILDAGVVGGDDAVVRFLRERGARSNAS